MNLTPLVEATYAGLADALDRAPDAVWDAPSLCEGWRVREVVAHVTTPARYTGEQFGAALAEAGGDFQALTDQIAARDAGLPAAEHLTNLRSSALAAWEPPGFGAAGALNHAVVHALDVTVALGWAAPAPDDALRAVLDALAVEGVAGRFDVDVTDRRFVAVDLDWAAGSGRRVVAKAGELVSLLTHRTLPDGRTLAD
ncbi:maleylpyruvate isomerase family mycothiol-dependent enzyme [Jatrophihabitans sp. YIM 134969]